MKYSASCPKFSPVWTSCKSMHHMFSLFSVARCRDRRKYSPPPRQHSQEHSLRHPLCSEKGSRSPCLCLEMQFPRKLEAALLAASLKTIQKFPILVSSIATTTSHSLSSCFNIYVDRCLHSSQKNSLKICPLISRLFRVISCLPQNKTQPPYHGLCKPCMIWPLLVPLTSSLASLVLTLF